MSNTENLPDEHFREKLENLEINPSHRVWGSISSHLEQSAIARSKRKVVWLWRISMVSLAISLFAVGYAIFDDRSEPVAANAPLAQNTLPTSTAANDDANGQPSMTADASNVNGPQPGASAASSSHAVSSSRSNLTVSKPADPSASAKGSMNVSTSPEARVTEGPKAPTEQESFFNEGSKLQRNEVRHAEPGSEPPVTFQEDPKPDPYASGKTLAPARIFPMATRQLTVQSRGLASELEELEYEELPEGKPCPHWIAGVNYTYGATFRDLKDDEHGKSTYPQMYIDKHKLTKSYFDSIENKSTGYVQGLSLGYRTGRFTLRTGIEQSKYQWETKMATGILQTGPEPTFVISTAASFYSNDTLGENYASQIFSITVPSTPPQYEDTVTLIHTFRYSSVPLTMSYSFTRPCSKWGIAITGGMAASFLKSYTLVQDGSPQAAENDYIRKTSYQLIAGASVSYAPVRWLSIELQPTYRRFIQPVNRLQSVKTYPYMIGAQAGMYFRF